MSDSPAPPPAAPGAERPSDGLDQLRGIPRFASVIAHELRNPLSAVKIALQTLERHSDIAAKDSTRLRIALREVGTIERVLSEILDWARPPDLEVRDVVAGDLADAALDLAKRDLDEHRVTVEREKASESGLLRVDPERAAAALAELLRNAAQSSDEGAVVRLEVAATGPFLRFAVSDLGPGLTEDEAALAFDPFFSNRARGVGLGLPRARDIARAHGGEVRVSPLLHGRGTVAELLLPAVAPARG